MGSLTTEWQQYARMGHAADFVADEVCERISNPAQAHDAVLDHLKKKKAEAWIQPNILARIDLVHTVNQLLTEAFGAECKGNTGWDEKPRSNLQYILLGNAPKRDALGRWMPVGEFNMADGSSLDLAPAYAEQAKNYFQLYLAAFGIRPKIRLMDDDLMRDWQVNTSATEQLRKDTYDRYPELKDPPVLSPFEEYAYENGENFPPSLLVSGFVPKDVYMQAHAGLIIPCHDVMVAHQDGLLLVMRDNYPAKDVLWPIGGRIARGKSVTQSLKDKTKAECGLMLEEPFQFLGFQRTYFRTEPFGHGKGTDSINARYFAKGTGAIKMDELQSKPTIIKILDYTVDFRSRLDPYVQQFMDETLIFTAKNDARERFIETLR